MRLYNRYILTVTLLVLLSTVILVATRQDSLSVYYSVYVLEALIVTELFTYFNNRIRRGLASVSIVLFGGFLFTLCLEILKIIKP
jgi:hypothetical protein